MTNAEWNIYKARRAELLSRYHRRKGQGALAELFRIYARQYRERAAVGCA